MKIAALIICGRTVLADINVRVENWINSKLTFDARTINCDHIGRLGGSTSRYFMNWMVKSAPFIFPAAKFLTLKQVGIIICDQHSYNENTKNLRMAHSSALPCKHVIKRMAHIKYNNAVENPIDSLGDVATRTFGFWCSTNCCVRTIKKKVDDFDLHDDQLHALVWESSLNNDAYNCEETI